jgi:excisionase family DNA binding protein
MSATTGNAGLDALADAIAERVIARIRAQQEPPLMAVGEAAKYLGRGPGAVRGMIAKGILPSVRMSGRVMIRREDADRLIESSVTRV